MHFDERVVTRRINDVGRQARRRDRNLAATHHIGLERRGYLLKSSLGPNCVGLTKIVVIVKPHCLTDSATRLTWPGCNAPIVGTSPIDFAGGAGIGNSGAECGDGVNDLRLRGGHLRLSIERRIIGQHWRRGEFRKGSFSIGVIEYHERRQVDAEV